MKRKTKIVCTLGPAVDSEEGIKALIAAGMNVARINCSHGDWEKRKQWIHWIRKHSPDVSPIGILADLQGPKFRMGMLSDGSIELSAGQSVIVGPEPGAMIPVIQPDVVQALCPGCRLLLGDGNVELKLGQKIGANYTAVALTGGLVSSKQGVTVVGRKFDTDPITSKDLEDVREAATLGVDFIALSYVHAADDMNRLRTEVQKYNDSIHLCAKIETREAIKNIDEIVAASDLIMVARGDMGLQMDLEDVPLAQKKIIRKCEDAGTPVITATQMLESMVSAPRPTRAEVTDVANAILDGTDAVMLSGETAAGKYPVEAVGYMARVAEKAETAFDRARLIEFAGEHGIVKETEAVAHAVAQLSELTRPKAILTTTTSGQTARLVSKFRPRTPILCATWDSRTQCQLSVAWGVECAHMALPSSTDEQIENAIDVFKAAKRLKVGDHVIVSAGVPAGTPGNTNLIMLQVVR